MKLFISLSVLVISGVVYGNEECNEDANSFLEEVKYSDRNGDGIVDFESHIYPCLEDANWELRDDDYNGRYEIKLEYELAPNTKVVDFKIPEEVKIESK